VARAEALLRSVSVLLARGDQAEAARALHTQVEQELGRSSSARPRPYTSQGEAEEAHRRLSCELARERAKALPAAGWQELLGRLAQRLAWVAVFGIVAGLFLRYGYALVDRTRWQYQHPDGAWISRYYNRRNFQDYLLTRYDVGIDYDWGKGAPAEAMDRDHWSAKWDTCLIAKTDVKLKLALTVDDAGKLLLDEVLHIDIHQSNTKRASIKLTPGAHHLQVQYQERRKGAKVRLDGLDYKGTEVYHFQRPRLEGDEARCDGPSR
jgi:hypothetical protein